MAYEREYLPRWFEVWKFVEYCRYCGHCTQGNDVPAARQSHNRHVARCMKDRGLK